MQQLEGHESIAQEGHLQKIQKHRVGSHHHQSQLLQHKQLILRKTFSAVGSY